MRFTFSLAWLLAWACWALPNPLAESIFRGLPVTFERNQGQWPSGVEFGAHIAGHRYSFSNKEIVIDGSVRLDLVSSAHAKLEPLDPVATKTNYLNAKDPSKSIVQIPNYSRLEAPSAFPGIDLVLYGSDGQLEFDYVVAPGAEPGGVHLRVRGAIVKSAPDGLELTTPSGELLSLRAPIAYQNIRSGRKRIDCRFRIDSSGEISFVIGPYNRTAPLLIDPVLTYLGVLTATSSTVTSGIGSVTTDGTGAFYFAGVAMDSNRITTTPGVLRTSTPCGPLTFDCNDSWVIKLNASDHQVAWATYVGLTNSTRLDCLALDPSGNVVIGGQTGSVGFPVTPDAYLSTLPAAVGGFLTKLNPTGTAVVYSTLLENIVYFLKIDSHGGMYMSNGPTVQKLSADGSTMLYITQAPGGGVLQTTIDDIGNLYAVGATSPQFSVTPGAYKSSDNDGIYISKFDPRGNLVFTASFNAPASTLLRPDIAVDPSGNLVFTGQAGSGVPVVNDPEPQVNDCDPQTPCMAFVAALDPTGSSLLYSRLLGHGAGQKSTFGPNGEVYVAGFATDLSFPRTWDAFQYCSNPPGPTILTVIDALTFNGFVMRLGSQGEREFSSFLGTSSNNIFHMRLASDGTLYLGGFAVQLGGSALVGGAGGYFSAVIDTNQSPRVPHACLVNATQNVPDSNYLNFWVAPGQMVTLFGEGLGPQASVPAEWNADGSLSNTLAGVQVLFDGIPAPMLYAQYNQVNCIVPFGVAGEDSTSIVVQYAGSRTDPLVFRVHPSVANPFTKGYFPGADVIAINEDGTLNSAENPAASGSVVTFYTTGLGQTNPPLQDGRIAQGAAPATSGIDVAFLPNRFVHAIAGQVLYQGAAPGEVAGVYQVNVRIPAATFTGHTQLLLGANGATDDGLNHATQYIWLK